VRTLLSRTIVKIEIDLGTDFFEVDSCNNLPLKGHQSLDISDFHTRPKQSKQGDVTGKFPKIVMH
jgi:hypothetical protein